MSDDDVATELDRLCRAITADLTLNGATVAVMSGQGSTSEAAASDDVARGLDELQFVLGEGPTSDAYLSGQPVLASELAADQGPWLEFAGEALARGVTGVYAFPLQLGAARLGVLTCYAGPGRRLSSDDVALCLDAAETARDLLLSAADHGDVDGRDVQKSLPIRSEVFQAQGMLTVALGLSLTDALAYLRAAAYAEEVDVNELAADLVHGRRPMPTPEPDPHPDPDRR